MTTSNSKDYAAITSVDQLQKMADQMIADGKPIGFDLETGYHGKDFAKRSVDHYNDNQFVVGFSFSNDPSWARYVPLRHDDGGNIEDVDAAWDAVREMLTVGDITAHNAKFEKAGVWKAAKIKLAEKGKLVDTMLDAFIVGAAWHANYRTMTGLKDLILELFDHQMMHIHELWPDLPANKFAYIRFNTLPIDPNVIAYACEDAAWVLPLRERVTTQALKERRFMHDLEHQIMLMMDDVERHGVYIDWEAIHHSYGQATSFAPAMEAYVKDELGKIAERDLSELNLNSPQQMKKLLFQDIGMTTTRMTKKGQDDETMPAWQRMSTDQKSLVALADEYDAVKALLEYREVQNLLRRHKKWVTEYSLCFDGRVHANYNQALVGSGRFSANDPAIQQLPKKWHWWIDDEGKKKEGTNGKNFWAGNFRNFVTAAPGNYLLTYDYSQVELRMLAGASQEPALLQAFSNDDDVHTLTAAMMLGKDPFDIDEETERPIGKTFNFALMYGMGPKSLGEQLGIDFERAQELYKEYFKVFSNVATWVNTTRNLGLQRGYAETIFGRKIPVWELRSQSKAIQAKGSRVLINGPIQGSAADYMKIAMMRAYKELVKRGWWGTKVTIIMNQHDALTFEVSNDIDPNELRDILQARVVFDENLSPTLKGYPRFRADWELGQRWGSSTKWAFTQTAAKEGGLWTVQPESEYANFRIVLPSDPSETEFRNFVKSLKEAPGETTVCFSSPGGSVQVPFTSSVTASSADKLKRLFRDATVEVS